MDSKPMDRQSEDTLIKAARMVMAYVEQDGENPDTAIVKTAEELKIGREMLPLLVQTYNIGRTTYQQNHGGTGILAKQAAFPIARIENIQEQLYPADPPTPAQVKAASVVSDEYSRPPAAILTAEAALMSKAAAWEIPRQKSPPKESLLSIDNAFSLADRHKRAMAVAHRRYTTTRDNYLGAMGKLTEYFKQSSYWRLPFDEVEWTATRRFGKAAKHALSYAYTQAGLKESRATGPPSILREVDYTATPYTLIDKAIKYAEALLVASQEKTAAEETAEEVVKESFRPFEPSPELELSTASSPGSILSGDKDNHSLRGKEANFLTSMGAVALGSKLKGMDQEKTPGDLVSDVSDQLSDPDHLGQLRQIQTRAMLSDMLRNDEVISGYDPQEVFDAYNELSQLSPRAATQPMVVRPILRRRLTQGAMEPFEAQQVADLEKTITQVDTPEQPKPMKMSEVLSASPILR